MKRVFIDFCGGPFDGQCFDSASGDENAQSAAEFYRLFGQMQEGARRQERMKPLDQVIRRASPILLERAEAESWSEAKRRAMMAYYDYVVDERNWLETENEVLIRATYSKVVE